MANIKVDFLKKLGNIKPMHAVGQPPLMGLNTTLFKYLKEAHIPYSRLHDVAGWHGGNMFVDIPNVFRDFDADENDPASYDFAFTDILIKGLMDNGCPPVYRLGVTIENFHQIKAYRIFPPKDFAKWARICEHIIRHYNEGWADGFHYDIKYWEIWNEPDSSKIIENNPMWKGTPEQFFDLYRITSKHLRECFGDSIKIGGYGSCGFYAIFNALANGAVATGRGEIPEEELIAFAKQREGYVEFFERFIKIVHDENLPFDFFSYHSYATVDDTMKMQMYVERRLKEVGLENTEIHLNEWNPEPALETRGTALVGANIAAMMSAMQDTKMDVMCFYDAGIGPSIYRGLFNPTTHKPFCSYYALKAFGELYALGTQVETENDTEKLYITAATNGEKNAVLISNTGEDREIETNLDDDMVVYLIDDDHFMVPVEYNPKKFQLKANTLVYIAK